MKNPDAAQHFHGGNEILELTSGDQPGQSSQRITVKNNLAALRNRSTSPTIIPKKYLLKK